MRFSFRTTFAGVLVLCAGLAFSLPADASSSTPSAPTSVHAVGASASATVTWAKPSKSGSSKITKYVVTSSPSSKTCTTTTLTCRVTGLKNATAYRFRVVAYNKSGAGAPSGASNKVTPMASTKRTLVVTPSKGLTNGETVKVSGSGFTPNDSVFILECLANATGQSGCAITGIPTPISITAKGVLPTTTFKVATGTIGTGTCGTTAANASACAISVGNASGGDTMGAVISFKP